MDFPIETTIHDKSIILLFLHSFHFDINHTRIQQQNTRNLADIKDNRHIILTKLFTKLYV